MHSNDLDEIESQTLDWVQRVVVGLNLCPFAQAVMKSDDLMVVSETSSDVATVLTSLAEQFDALLNATEQATVLFLLPNGFELFDDYLDLVDLGNALLIDLGFEGILQMATFHPHYLFSGSDVDDAANYTNRSPFPMLHLLQESAVEEAVRIHPDTASVPQRNIDKLRAMSHSQIESLVIGEVIKHD